jgi:hypothetical protein
MTKFTCELIKPSHTIAFHNGSKQVGLLDFNGPVMTFEGDVDESAKVFFDFLAERFTQRLSEKCEWKGLTDDEISKVLGSDIHAEQSGELSFIRAIEAKLKEKNND